LAPVKGGIAGVDTSGFVKIVWASPQSPGQLEDWYRASFDPSMRAPFILGPGDSHADVLMTAFTVGGAVANVDLRQSPPSDPPPTSPAPPGPNTYVVVSVSRG